MSRLVCFLGTLLLLAAPYAVAQSSPNSYFLGPGDQIQIQVYGEDDLTVKMRIEEDGILSYPFLGDIRVEGLTIDALQSRIYSGLKGGYLVNPDVRVFMVDYRPVFVNGQVRKPGGYSYVPGLTVQKAIALAGGTTDLASTRGLAVIREGSDKAKAVAATLDTPLGPGDILVVDERFF
jgi:protein involved in polysaccharide export with SLBB domain